ncbi:MAG: ankyrin repeat domain-containing protein [bacterium]
MASDDVPQIDNEFATAIADRDYQRATAVLNRGAAINRVIRRTETFDRDVVEETTSYLIDASAVGDVDGMTFLLEHGADVNTASDFSGQTALLAAARFGHVAAVDLLLAHGADVAAVDRYNARQTALGYATESVNPAIVRSVLAAGARGTFRRVGFSVDGAARARDVVRLLVEHKADINEVDDWGRTPLMWAAQHAEPETVRFMIELGADVNRVSEANMNGVRSNETALGLARKRKRDDVVALLLRHGARDVASGRGRWASLFAWLWNLLTR